MHQHVRWQWHLLPCHCSTAPPSVPNWAYLRLLCCKCDIKFFLLRQQVILQETTTSYENCLIQFNIGIRQALAATASTLIPHPCSCTDCTANSTQCSSGHCCPQGLSLAPLLVLSHVLWEAAFLPADIMSVMMTVFARLFACRPAVVQHHRHLCTVLLQQRLHRQQRIVLRRDMHSQQFHRKLWELRQYLPRADRVHQSNKQDMWLHEQ